MSIENQMHEYLLREGAATPETIAASIADLNLWGGAERTLLLLRLNPQFEKIESSAPIQKKTVWDLISSSDDDTIKDKIMPWGAAGKSKWIARGTGKSDEDVIHDAALQYFKAQGKSGVPIANVVMEVTRTTGLNTLTVEQALRSQFMTMNTNIFNRPNRQEDI